MQERVLDSTYRLLEEIGRGGFGAVYRAVRIGGEAGGSLAVKLLHRDPSLSSQDYARFQREATFMSQLVHPGIVAVYELGEEARSYYIVMEYVSGKNLRDAVKARGGTLPLAHTLDILIQCADALDYVHSHSIVHRDIKPQNILLCDRAEGQGDSRHHVKIVDFGVARLSYSHVKSENKDTKKRDQEVVGTYAYMAPESTGLVDWPIDHRCDIYSLGIVAYELISGKTPFADLRGEQLMRAQVTHEAPGIRDISDANPHAVLERLVLKCLNKRPEDRYQSMFALACDLRRIQLDLKSSGQPQDFELGTKDYGIGKVVEGLLVGRAIQWEGISQFLSKKDKRARVSWGVITGEVGAGKTRLLDEARRALIRQDIRYIQLKFSESEKRLDYQALVLGINDYLAYQEKQFKAGFKDFMAKAVSRLGDSAVTLSRYIPAIRHALGAGAPSSLSPHWTPNSFAKDNPSHLPQGEAANHAPNDPPAENDVTTLPHNSVTLENRFVPLLDPVPSSSYQSDPFTKQAFVELLVLLAGEGSTLVFLVDDLHFADRATLSLCQFIVEKFTQQVNFTFLATSRLSYSLRTPEFDIFIERLRDLKHRFKQWELKPLQKEDVKDYLRLIGLRTVPEEFLSFCLHKSKGIPLQLISLVKQLLADNILNPSTSETNTNVPGTLRDLFIDWQRLADFDIDVTNIEILIGSIETLEKKDLKLLRIAALVSEACEFELFRVDDDFSTADLSGHLNSLVKRRLLVRTGDESIPIQRAFFVLFHERIKNALISAIDQNTQKQLNKLISHRMMSLYKSPKKEQWLALARHCDGAAEQIEATTACLAFTRAFQVLAQGLQYSLALYYIDKVTSKLDDIKSDKQRQKFLRDIFEVKYTIFAAQGNLLAASEVCEQLISITPDPARQLALKDFWAQLLLGLGRYQNAKQVTEGILLEYRVVLSNWFTKILKKFQGFFSQHIMEKILYPLFFIKHITTENRNIALHATVIHMLSELNGYGKMPFNGQFALLRLLPSGMPKSRWDSVANLMKALLLLRQGNITKAYELADAAESTLKQNGMLDGVRWLNLLKAIWLDYPLGRVDRVFSHFTSAKNESLPASGLLHFETFGLRGWLKLLSPSVLPSKDDHLKRRRSDQNAAQSDAMAADQSFESNNSRRVLDSGETSQYIALALFSDAIRALSEDKSEPLRRATDQFRRQKSSSELGRVLAMLSFGLSSFFSGRQKSSLQWYVRSYQTFMSSRADMISLVVTDAIKLGFILLPLIARSTRAQGWPWGRQLEQLLGELDVKLTHAEGEKNPRRNAMSVLFSGVKYGLQKKWTECFSQLDSALREARSQKLDFLECLTSFYLGIFCGEAQRQSRVHEHLTLAMRTSQTYEWSYLAKRIGEVCKEFRIELDTEKPAEEPEHHSTIGRSKATSKALHSLVLGLQGLNAEGSQNELLTSATKVLCDLLRTGRGFFFGLDETARSSKFHLLAKFEAEARKHRDIKETEIQKSLPLRFDVPIRIVQLEDSEDSVAHQPSVLQFTTQVSEGIQEPDFDAENQTRALFTGKPQADVDAAGTVATVALGVARGSQQKGTISTVATAAASRGGAAILNTPQRYLVLVAASYGTKLFGWWAFPDVDSERYLSLDVEQDLILTGLHVGHLLNRSKQNQDQNPESISKALPVARRFQDGELPKDVLCEVMGELAADAPVSWRVYRLRGRRILVATWHFECKNQDVKTRLHDLCDRHLQFFVSSERQKNDTRKMDFLMTKLAADLSTMFHGMSREERFFAIDCNILLWDSEEKLAIEGIFGSDLFSFSGSSLVDKETSNEVPDVLMHDRLFYRERTRAPGEKSGWLFAGNAGAKELLPKFAKPDFVKQYLNQRTESPGQSLAHNLGVKTGQEPPPALALFLLR